MKFLLNVKIGVEHTIEYTNDLTSKIITLPELVKVDTGEAITPKLESCTETIQVLIK